MVSNRYRDLMDQISLSEQAKHNFYSNSQQPDHRKSKRIPMPVAAIAVCIVLLIPITVLAMESIFGVAIIDSINRPNAYNRPGVGVDVKYGNVSSRPITDFSEHLRNFTGSIDVSYGSWEEAQVDLGIDLLENQVCNEKETQKIDYYVDGELVQKHCTGRYLAEDGQLYYANLRGIYRRNSVEFQVTATVTAEHPTVTEEVLMQCHESGMTYFDSFAPQVETQQYITKAGIPVTMCVVKMEDDYGTFADYKAYLAVDDVTYCVSCIGVSGRWDDERISAVLKEVLEGFLVA